MRAENTDRRVLVHVFDHGAERIRADFGVGVEQQNVFALRSRQSDIVAAREADVFLLCQQLRRRVLLPYHLRTVVFAGRIHHNNFNIERSCLPTIRRSLSLVQTAQAFLQQIADIPADDDDGKVNQGVNLLTSIDNAV